MPFTHRGLILLSLVDYLPLFSRLMLRYRVFEDVMIICSICKGPSLIWYCDLNIHCHMRCERFDATEDVDELTSSKSKKAFKIHHVSEMLSSNLATL